MRSKIEVCGISKTFEGRGGAVPVLDDISFSVRDGEFVALVGPSGCGKSTFLNILAGFDRPDAGEVLIDGEPVRKPSRKAVFIFQQPSLFPWYDLGRNIAFGLYGSPVESWQSQAAHYMALVGLEGFERAFPQELSGGMQQRAELARALMVKPEILFMDEPFGALDALTRIRIRAELLRILAREHHTVLLVTHDVEEALHLADRVIVFSSRPAMIQKVIDITIPRPRLLSSPALTELKVSILGELGVVDEPGATGS